MAGKRVRHVHKYERTTIGKNSYVVYRCVLPDCTHYLSESLIGGKESICWRCGDICVIPRGGRIPKRPHCEKCTKVYNRSTDKPKPDLGKLSELDLDALLGGLDADDDS
jgi:hypothetical protein